MAEVIAVAFDIWDALLITVAVLAVLVELALLGLVLLLGWAAKRARKPLSAPLVASQPSSDSESTTPAKHPSEPHTPAWARKETA